MFNLIYRFFKQFIITLLEPSHLIRYAWQFHKGLKLFNYNIVRIFFYIPSHVNSFSCVYNLLHFKNYIQPKTIIDIDANISQVTRLLTLKNKADEIISFEPNTKLKPLGKVFNVLLSDKEEKAYFSIDDTYGGLLSKIVTKKDTSAKTLNTVRFDKIIADIKFDLLPQPILLKVDVEGHTKEVLEGMGIYLQKIDSVLVEIDNAPELLDIYSLLNKNGFKNSKIVYSATHRTDTPVYFDVYFWK